MENEEIRIYAHKKFGVVDYEALSRAKHMIGTMRVPEVLKVYQPFSHLKKTERYQKYLSV
jgi:hypothetical protein